ncbi:MAG: urate hydroxylase PuuD [Acidobacteriota bacterium]|nr:urate hydroxylase PuuD [Acidobacteriota bacterium]
MHLADLLALLVMPTHTNTENLQIVLRWIHFLGGITWIGLLYFFNLINVPFMKNVDAAAKPNVFKNLTLPAMWWFRWSAVVTVVAGFWYWAQTIVAADAHNANVSPWGAIGMFLLIWVAVWVVEFLIVSRAPAMPAINKGPVYAIIAAVLIGLGTWGYVTLTDADWVSSRMLAIGIGGGYGLVMMLNVWGIIWRNNKKIINGTLAGTPPADAAALARQAFLASRTNAWLSIPMLFFMAAASHYPFK